jgi:hypothetical protein
LVTVVAREVVPTVQSKENGDLPIGCEHGAGKSIVGEEVTVAEGRDYEVVLEGVVGARITWTRSSSIDKTIINDCRENETKRFGLGKTVVNLTNGF